MIRSVKSARQGSALLEFALAGSFIFVPLLAGMATVGFQMVEALQVSGLTRDAGHMLASGTDFAPSDALGNPDPIGLQNQAVLQRIAGSINLTTSGNAVVILSTIQADATTGTPSCIMQLIIGNSSLKTSQIVTPASGVLLPDGTVNSASANDPSLSPLSAFTSAITLQNGQTTYVAETFVSTPNFIYSGSSGGIYNRVFF